MSDLALVTGAGGHLGANLLRRLLSDVQPVRALLHSERDRRAVEGLAVDVIVGDLRDADLCRAAVAGCSEIYHCAAKISTFHRDHSEVFACNVIATRQLLAAALREGVRKVVVTGSFSATGRHADGSPSDETVPFNPLEGHLPYAMTKAAVEHECLKAVIAGLPVVVAVSTAILGPHDYKPSRMGQVLRRYAAGKLRAYTPGGFEFIAARDIAEGHVLAMRRGLPGEKYIFASSFQSFDDIMRMFSKVTGQPMPPWRVPARAMSAVARVAGVFQPLITPDREQLLTPAAIRILQQCRRADITKAREKLGFEPTSIEDAIAEAYEWFCARGEIVPVAPRRAASAGQEARA